MSVYLSKEERFKILSEVSEKVLAQEGYKLFKKEDGILVFYADSPVKFHTEQEYNAYITKLANSIGIAYHKRVEGKDSTHVMSIELDGAKLEIKIA